MCNDSWHSQDARFRRNILWLLAFEEMHISQHYNIICWIWFLQMLLAWVCICAIINSVIWILCIHWMLKAHMRQHRWSVIMVQYIVCWRICFTAIDICTWSLHWRLACDWLEHSKWNKIDKWLCILFMQQIYESWDPGHCVIHWPAGVLQLQQLIKHCIWRRHNFNW